MADSAENRSLLDMSDDVFVEFLGGLAEREQSTAALLAARRAAIETREHIRSVESATDLRLGRNMIESLAWGLNRFTQQTLLPSIAALGVAMQVDFEQNLREIGGRALLPIPEEEAWDNFTQPMRFVIELLRAEIDPLLSVAAEIRSKYKVT